MRILLASAGHTLMTGGAEAYVRSLARALNREHDVGILTVGDAFSVVEEIDGIDRITLPEHNVTSLQRLPRQSAPVKALWHLLDLKNRKMAKEIRRALEKWKPDLLHTHKIDGLSFSIYTVAAKLSIPTLHTLHDYAAICPYAIMTCPYKHWKICRKPPLPCALLLRGKRRAMKEKPDRVIAPSRAIALLHQRFGFFGDIPVTILPNGIPNPPGSLRRSRPEGFHLLYAGGLTRHKGVSFLLDLWEEIRNEEGIILHVAGDGPLKKMVEAAADRNERFIYHGALTHDEVRTLMAQFHILLLPSLCLENCPLVIGEAATVSLPVIASAIGGIPQFIEPGFRKGGRSEAQKSPPDMAKHSDDRRWRSHPYGEEEGASRAIDGGKFQAAVDHTCEIRVNKGVTGELLPPGDVTVWKEAILDLSRDATRWSRMAAAVRKSAEAWSMEKHIATLESLYAQTLKEARHEA